MTWQSELVKWLKETKNVSSFDYNKFSILPLQNRLDSFSERPMFIVPAKGSTKRECEPATPSSPDSNSASPRGVKANS